MGLFSNKNKLCPICGEPTPRLLATKIQGEPLCSRCGNEIMADDELVKIWSVDDAKSHLEYRARNKSLVESFPASRTLDYGRELVIDDSGKRFYIKQWSEENPPVFQFSEIQGFEIELGWETVESWCRGMQRVPYQPPQMGMLGAIAAFANALDDDKNKRDEDRSETLRVMLKLDNPYLREYELQDVTVDGDNALEYQQKLSEELSRINSVCNLLVALSGSTEGPAVPVAAPAAAPAGGHAADEILKFKGLLDAGAITQAEFDAKKKQLLGI